jgi:hypothetical protein
LPLKSLDFNERTEFATRSNLRYFVRLCEFLTLRC